MKNNEHEKVKMEADGCVHATSSVKNGHVGRVQVDNQILARAARLKRPRRQETRLMVHG